MSISNAITTPAAGTTESIKLEPGTSHQFGFKLSDIVNATPRADGGLELKLSNNSTVIIENFKDLVNSKDICGEDSALLLLDDKAGAEGFSLVNLVKSMADRFEDRPANDNEIALNAPTANATKEVVMEPGMKYLVNFDIDQVGKTVDGDNLILSFQNGGIMILRDYAAVTAGELPPALTLADGSVINPNTLITAACAVDMPKMAALTVPNIEPAAGEEAAPKMTTIARAVAQAEPSGGGEKMASAAEKVADIEPAAGGDEGGAGPSRGYGYTSSRDAINLGGLNPLGPIGPTDLNGNPPNVPPILGGGTPTTTTTNIVVPVDDKPILTAAVNLRDETVGTSGVLTGVVTANFGNDGPGTFSPSGTFAFGGSTNGTLTSGGQPVVVTQVGNTYTGTAGGLTIFTMVVNADGTYTFNQIRQLDHADATNPNDVINLTFGVNATDADGDVGTTTITVGIVDDAPVAVNDVGSVVGGVANGNVLTNDDLSNDVANTVSGIKFGTNPVQTVAGATVINGAFGVLTINPNGTYSYVANNGANGTDTFTYTLRDGDGDTSTATVSFTTADGAPVIGDAERTIDETNGQPVTITGALTYDYGTDGKGATGTIAAVNNFTAGGSLLGGNLTSHGVPVTVTLVGNTYTGTAGGVTVFSLTVNTDGTYSFTQNRPLDHADGVNPNDVITLNFGVRITDADGDSDPGTIRINIVDDAPRAADTTNSVDETTLSNSVTGQLNASYGNDNAGNIHFTVAPAGYTGFGASGSLKNGALTSNGVPVTVTLSGGVYTGTANGVTVFTLTVNNNGQYTFQQFKQLDHADGTNPNDAINLTFCYDIVDADGDTATANLIISVRDDAPVAVNDVGSVVGGVANGNVLTNDDLSNDVANTVSGIKFGTNPVQTVAGATVINGAFGVLTINPNGTYSYVANNGANGTDTFTYTLRDGDGDTSTATVSFTTADGAPVIGDAERTIDETNGQPVTITGALTYDYGTDGKGATGTIAAVNNFTAGGSLLGGNLTSHGVPVTVTLVGNTYTGTAGGVTVFSLTVNTDGTYSFTQNRPLDHADGVNPNDVITLNFGVRITDADGDSDPGTIRINIVDDAPRAADTTNSVDETTLSNSVTGQLNASYGNDNAGNIHFTVAPAGYTGFGASGSLKNGALTSNGVPVTVTLSGGVYTGTANGVTVFTLTVNNNGQYTFQQFKQLDHADGTNPNDAINLTFCYDIVDADGDTATANLIISVRDDAPVAVNDVGSVVGGVANGNVLTNDDLSNDVANTVSGIKFGTNPVQTVAGATVINGAFGVLTINPNGTYSYVANNGANGTDTFTYTLRDGDGDTSTATVSFTTADGAPVIGDAERTIDETNGQPVTITGALTYDYGTDGKGATGTIAAVNNFTAGGSLLGGNLTSHGVPVTVTLVGNTYTGTAGGVTVFSLTVNTDGTYSFTQNRPLDHADGVNPNDVITLNFGVRITDADGDSDPGTIRINIVDDAPRAADTTNSVDETTLSNSVTGQLNASYGNDNAGNIHFTVAPAGYTGFGASGSLKNGALTSNGVPVTVTLSGGVYTGTANGVTVFTLTVNNNGQYTFQQFKQLDHADGTNPNDAINLTFCYDIVDADGDTATANLIISVRDDAPVAVNDVGSVVGGVANGNVLTNDDLSNDVANTVSGIKFGTNPVQTVAGATVINGAFGVLTINPNGTYSYVANNGANGTDTFTYTLRDGDGDTSTATVSFTTADGKPVIGDAVSNIDETTLGPITVNGTYTFNYGPDGQGTTGSIKAVNNFSASGSLLGGNLTSNGVPVTVTLVGNTYTGTAGGVTVFTLVVNTNGTYSFTQNKPLDHADGANANDVISLNFGTLITDADGDTDPGTIRINIADDGVDARADAASVNGCNPTTTGNVMTNDVVSKDVSNTISKVTFNGVDYNVPTSGNLVVTGAFGVLTIAANGAYSYTGNNHANGTDVFTYTLKDFDGDRDTTTLTLTTADGMPIAHDTTNMVDETVLANSATGTFNGSFGPDGAGNMHFTVAPAGYTGFTATGSLKNGVLTSGGIPVSVSLVNGKYIGTAGGQTVFEVTIDSAGHYVFNQFKPLDHADGTNPNDVINLSFCVDVVDCDGDQAQANLIIGVKDDAPVLTSDYIDALNYACIVGNILTNDHIGNDVNANPLFQIQFNGATYNVPTTGIATIIGLYGTLEINAKGEYTYYVKPNQFGQHIDYFTYSVRDGDGDVASATFAIRNDGCGCGGPTANVTVNTEVTTEVVVNTVAAPAIASSTVVASNSPTAINDLVSFDDAVQVGINNFIDKTTVTSTPVGTSVHVAEMTSGPAIMTLPPVNDNSEQQHHQAIAGV